MDFSIVIPSYNNAYKLELALKYLALQECVEGYKLQVIIVDDYSKEDISGVVSDFEKRNPKIDIKIIRNESNLGLAASRNIGAGYCDSDYIMFLDNDIVMSPKTLYYHISAHKESKPKVVLSSISDVNKENFHEIINHLKEADILDISYINNNLEDEMDPYFLIRETILRNYQVSRNCMWVFGACFCTSMPKEIFQSVGGFDTNFKGWGPEDIDFNYRAYKQGYDFKFCKEAVCYHLDYGQKDINLFVRDVTRNSKYFSNKHSNKEVENYMRFYKGSISYEELEAYMNGIPFIRSKYDNLHYIGIIHFLKAKAYLN